MDEWEALFGIWHERTHGDKRDVMGILTALAELEGRIVNLEAIIMANEKQAAMAARVRRRGSGVEDRA